MLKDLTPTPLHKYHVETFSDTPNPRPGTGLLILDRHDSVCIRLAIYSILQAMAIQTNLNKKISNVKILTICNIYIPPGQKVTVEKLRNLSDQLPQPFLMVGDFSGKHTAWGNKINDQRGRIIEEFLIDSDICLLNTGETTHTFRRAPPQQST
jgi:hypothetical protein